jgi:hypothetical protein
MHGAEEVAGDADLLVRAEGEGVLADPERAEHVAQLAQQLDVDDELLITGDEAALDLRRMTIAADASSPWIEGAGRGRKRGKTAASAQSSCRVVVPIDAMSGLVCGAGRR